MDALIEDRLHALYESAKSGSEAPTEIFLRLRFLADLLRDAPKGGPPGVRLLWRDPHGKVVAMAVGGESLVIGRGEGSGLVLPSPRLSRRHCRVFPTTQGFHAVAIEDLDSTNGTLVNGVRLRARIPRILRDGDLIEVGGIALAVVRPSDQPS